jgi:hypothetical protein
VFGNETDYCSSCSDLFIYCSGFTEENKPEQPHAQIVVHKAEIEGGLNGIIVTGEIGPPDGAAFLIKIFGSL